MINVEDLKKQGVNVWGYVRVSTKDQKLDRQLDAMQDYGVPESHIWEDKETGKTFNRPEYKKMIRVAQRGDIIVIKSIDRPWQKLYRDTRSVADDHTGHRLWNSCTGYACFEYNR